MRIAAAAATIAACVLVSWRSSANQLTPTATFSHIVGANAFDADRAPPISGKQTRGGKPGGAGRQRQLPLGQ